MLPTFGSNRGSGNLEFLIFFTDSESNCGVREFESIELSIK